MPADEHERSSIPYLLLPVNASPENRHHLGFATLLSLIGGNVKPPGSKKPDPLNPNHMMALIRDELAFLEKYGIRVWDASKNEFFICRVKCISFISDYRGLHKHLGMKVRFVKLIRDGDEELDTARQRHACVHVIIICTSYCILTGLASQVRLLQVLARGPCGGAQGCVPAQRGAPAMPACAANQPRRAPRPTPQEATQEATQEAGGRGCGQTTANACDCTR